LLRDEASLDGAITHGFGGSHCVIES